MSREPGLDGRHHWQRAIDLASRRHTGQFRRNGVTPYVSHPVRVAMVAATVFGVQDERILAAAVLHDLIEDTTVDYDELVEHFDHEIADWVAALSKDKRLPEDRREAEYDRAIAAAPWPVRLIKLADVYDNLCDCDDARRSAALDTARRALVLAATDPELEHASACLDAFVRTMSTGDVAPS